MRTLLSYACGQAEHEILKLLESRLSRCGMLVTMPLFDGLIARKSIEFSQNELHQVLREIEAETKIKITQKEIVDARN